MDFVGNGPTVTAPPAASRGHSRTSSTDSALWALHHNTSNSSHMRQKSAAFTEQFSIPSNESSRPASVILLAGHHNWISAAYSNNGQLHVFAVVIDFSLSVEYFSGDVLQNERYQWMAIDV